MKIMTFNTQHCQNYVEKKIDYEIMANAIKSIDPDVIVLNEMRDIGDAPGYEAQTRILAELCGMKHFYFAKAIDVYDVSSPYGNAIMSKLPFDTVETVKIPMPKEKTGKRCYESRCLLKAKLKCGLWVLGIHAGLNPDEHELAIQAVLDNVQNEKCIVMGDFNMRPENPLFERFNGILTDVAVKFGSPLLSFPSDLPTKKIDYIFTTPDVKIISADIPSIIASDHRPHTAEIDF